MAVFGNTQSTRNALAAPSASANNWTVDDIRKSDILIFRKSATEYIDTVVAPNGFQVGLLDEAFLTDLLVTGHITGSGEICAVAGFKGSLQKLVDGTDYLRGGTGISISNHDDGYITITNTGSGGSPTVYTAGTALTLNGSQFNVDYDNTTVGVNSSSELEVKRTPGTLTAGNGFYADTFTGAANKTISVKPVSGSPITVSSSGVGMNISTTNAISLAATDEIIIQQGSSVGKSTVQDILNLVPNPSVTAASKTEAYLVASISSDLSNERVLNAGTGIAVNDSPGTSSFTVSAVVESNGGLSLATGKLAVKIADFTGFGLSDSAGSIIVDSAALAGPGLTTSGQQLALDFSAVAAASNSITISPGDGLNLGGTATIGTASSTINLEVSANDIAGTGTTVTNNNINVNLIGQGGISVSLDGNNALVVDGSALGDISEVTGGTGLTGGGTSGLVTLNVSGLTVDELAASSLTLSSESFADNDTTLMTGAAINDLIEAKGYTTQAGDVTSVTAGTGLSGGGNTGDITLNVSDVTLTEIHSNSLITSAESFADDDTTIMTSAAIDDLIESKGYTTQIGDITKVTAGTGLSGGGDTGAVSLALDASELTALGTAAENSDYVVIQDATDNSTKKVLISNLPLVGGSGGSGNVFSTISVSGQSDVIADSTADTLTFAAGSNITITTTAGTDTVTIASADTNTQLTTEEVQDIVGGMIDDTETGISVTYDDTNGNLEFVVSDTTVAGDSGSTGITPGDTLTIAGGTNVTTSMSGDTLTINASASGEAFKIISVSGQDDVVADAVSDTLTLVAGDNITITTSAGSDAVTIASSGATQIGTAEDADYTDGLFTDFTTTTNVGTAIDRFNEVLKGLAPAAAPQLDDIDCDDTGTSAKLSFGNSQSISGYSNARPSTLSPSSNLSDIDINSAYSTATASNDLRRACFGAMTTINGTLNEDVSADGSNYAADSFGDGNQGTLKLYVNNNSTAIHTADLSSFGGGTSLNGNGSGFILSAITPSHFSDGSNFATFQHRQGTYLIHPADQRNGWNYVRIVHTVGGSDRVCNYVEWVNDPTGAGVAMSTSGDSLGSLSMTGTKNLSGVKYHTGGTAAYAITIANAYRNVRSSSQITFGGSSTSVPAQNIPDINHGAGEDETKSIVLSGLTATINTDPILNGSISVNTNVPHPLKSNLSGAGTQSISGILLYNLSDTASATSEPFRGESYRMKSEAYNAQADVSVSNTWDSTDSLLTIDGLLFYNQTLVAPKQGANSGDFDGITNGPGSNVDYSGITGTRTFFRKFTNNSGGSKTNFDLVLNGSGTIVASGGTLNSSNIKVFCKLPNNSSFSTGWMDLATAFASGQVADNDGCLVGSLDSSLNATNEVTFGTQSVGSNEYIVIKVLADGSWTGNISQMNISWL